MRFASIIAVFVLFVLTWSAGTGQLPGLGADLLDNEFVLDAEMIVRGRSALTEAPLADLVSERWWPSAEAGQRLHRPATLVFFAVVARTFADGTGDPEPFNKAVLLLHALNAVARFLLVALLLQGRRGRDLFAFLAALLPALHAISFESVVGIVGAAELLTALFMTLSWWCFALGWKKSGPMEGALLLMASPLLWFLALLSKETALLLPLVLIMHALVVRPPERARGAAVLFALLLAIAAGGGFLALRAQALGGLGVDSAEAVHAEFSTSERVASSMALLGQRYLPEVFRPDELQPNITHQDVTPPEGFGDRRVLLGLLVWIVALAWLFRAARRMRPEALLLLFALITYLPTSNLILPIDALGAWRFLYSPLFGIAAALALEIERAFRLRRRLRLVLTGLFAIVLVFGALGTARLIDDWQDAPTLYARASEIEPNSVWALHNAAVALDLSGRGPTNLDRLIENLDRYDAIEPGLATLPGRDRLDRGTRIVAARLLMDRSSALGMRAQSRERAARAADDVHAGVSAALRAETLLWEDRDFAFDARLRALTLRLMEYAYLQSLTERDAPSEEFTLREARADVDALEGMVRDGIDEGREFRFLLEAARQARLGNDSRRARRYLERALAFDGTHPEVAVALARLDVLDGRAEAALASLQACFDANRAHIEQHALAAQILDRLGRRKDAFVHWLNVAGLEPRNGIEKQLKDEAIYEINKNER